MSTEPQTLEELFEFVAARIHDANAPMDEIARATLIADAVYETAIFCLQVTPSTGHHQMYLASELLKRLRNFQSPFLVLSRQMGTDEELRAHFEKFMTTTADWRKELH